MNFIDNIRNELEIQMAARELYCEALEKMPQGRLITKCRSNSQSEHYLYNSSSEPMKYLGKKDRALITQLQQKKVLETGIKALDNNIPLLEQVVNKYIHTTLPLRVIRQMQMCTPAKTASGKKI